MEQGSFAQVETRIRGYARPAPTAETLPMPFDNPALYGEGDRPDPEDLGTSPALAEFLVALDSKVDTVISMLSQQRLDEEFQWGIEIVELSGSGFVFLSDSRFEEGQSLEVALILNQFPMRVATAVGSVSTPQSDRWPNALQLNFSRIRESDLEAVMGFVFHEQRQRIRESKWSG